MSTEYQVLSNADEISRSAADEFVRRAEAAVCDRGAFTVALAGGTTPKSMYSLLAGDAYVKKVPWDKISFFWGDERHVPPSHADSNYRMAYEAMLKKVPVRPESIYRIMTEDTDAAAVAQAYEHTLRTHFSLTEGDLPEFDLVLLGMGPDGHTASLFPGTGALDEKTKLVAANWVEKFHSYRVTMTVPVLNNADCVIFMVSGAEKTPALEAVLQGDAPPKKYPAKFIRPVRGKLVWLLDRAAYPGDPARLVSSAASD